MGEKNRHLTAKKLVMAVGDAIDLLRKEQDASRCDSEARLGEKW